MCVILTNVKIFQFYTDHVTDFLAMKKTKNMVSYFVTVS